ncbi:electron transport complex subunit RsxG [Andreesenia angusta]|uniref:Ion-translocating oxidoreductase complex subunit G n=1 Tax=Andreesenia angusta TaxID=39480 RepID=A0A1S1V7C4_9FIRM|nr:RnfABCDGE type electron transport complex subunit G [Andreesenia angusta]OHW62491.1 electron transport complex subunit RsxG [Andreesenia angusta]
MKETVKLGVILFLITAIAAGILAFANANTEGKIAELEAQASNEARKSVLSEAETFEAVDQAKLDEIMKKNPEILEIYEALDGSKSTVGYVVKTSTGGYAGPIEVVTGVSTDGSITGMKVVKNTETPGLGTLAAEAPFQDQFAGKSIETELEVVKSGAGDSQIQALTGATITSKAVTKGVNLAVEASKLMNE